MNYCTNHRNNNLPLQLGLAVLLFTSGACPFLVGQARSESSQSGPTQASEKWRSHNAAAKAALSQASECLSQSLKSANHACKSSALLQKASDEYSQMESLLASVSGQVEEVVVVAYGFLRSGLPGRAVELLMSRTETRTDPVLSHLLADSLFAIGDYRNAALAYKTWIKTGCGGYLYSMQDTDYWILPVKGDVCSFLPVALRSRLEMLKDATNGEPANLPTHNRPAAKFVLH